jgi:hypothetical protein
VEFMTEDVGAFAARFTDFMTAMTAAAERPESRNCSSRWTTCSPASSRSASAGFTSLG